MSVNEKMTAIAAKIREKLGTTEKLGLDEMAESIDKVYEAGRENASGGGDNFVDKYIDYGKRTDFNYAFAGVGWNDDNLKLNYPIQPTTAESMFYGAKISYVDIDFSKCKNVAYVLRNSSVVEVKEIDVSALDASAVGLLWAFAYTPIVTIGLLKSNSTVLFNNTFYGCYDLKNITIDGEIGQDINFQWSKYLIAVSVQSVIDHLIDLTGQTAKMVKFDSTITANLTDEQKLQILNKNWNIG